MITIKTAVAAPVAKVWAAFTEPEHITKWAFAAPDWEAPHAENDVRVGGKFLTRMQAKDGSAGFDFSGTYTAVKEGELIAYEMADGRKVEAQFVATPEGVIVTQSFDPENQNSEEMQRQGWQAILDNFKTYTESLI
jgi:uncharacterized protein YndB with AHSA1/START domain